MSSNYVKTFKYEYHRKLILANLLNLLIESGHFGGIEDVDHDAVCKFFSEWRSAGSGRGVGTETTGRTRHRHPRFFSNGFEDKIRSISKIGVGPHEHRFH